MIENLHISLFSIFPSIYVFFLLLLLGYKVLRMRGGELDRNTRTSD